MFARSIKNLFLIPLLVGIMASCSSNRDNELDAMLAKVATDTDIILVSGNIEHLFEQLDIEVEKDRPVLPDYLQRAVNLFGGRALREATSVFTEKIDGINYEDVLIAVKKDMKTIITFGLEDEGAFTTSIKKENKNIEVGSVGEYTTIGDEYAQILIKDNLAFVVVGRLGALAGQEAVNVLEEAASQASSAPLARWKKKYLAEDCVISAVVNYKGLLNLAQADGLSDFDITGMSDMIEYVTFNFNLDGPEAKIESRMLDKEGEIIKQPYIGKFDTSLMAYSYPNDFVGVSFSLNNKGYTTLGSALSDMYKKTTRSQYSMFGVDRQMESMIDRVANLPAEFLADGGVFGSLGYPDGVTLAQLGSNPMVWHFVVAADIKPEKIDEAFKSVTQLLAEEGTVTVSPDSKKAVVKIVSSEKYDYRTNDWVKETYDINVVVDGNTLVVSNDEVRKNKDVNFSKEVFAESAFGLQVIINEKNPVVSMMGIRQGVDFYVYCKEKTNEMVLKVTNSDKKIIPSTLGLLTGAF